ncbi:uncharacterized protein AB675_7272 [Cyphellophora attinorum]|uniref:Uncharacterized protein n=1 Tax=Cyphellophora attinorum TaxID=1664694 RepID=A0A0N0NJ67_9EURO|nr:uncharacterized protein AB675_7272 [Phialophora attinorum]KPI36259.1 hypothetical protein AB675_7272 [Phialophora attinorum]
MTQSSSDLKASRASTRGEDVTSLMSLPDEILEMIFEECFRNHRFHARPMKSTNKLMVDLPRSLRTSKRFRKIAQPVALHHVFINPPSLTTGDSRPSGILVSLDVSVLQSLKINHPWKLRDVKFFSKTIKAVPGLQKLILCSPFRIPMLPRQVESRVVDDSRLNSESPLHVALRGDGTDAVKECFTKILERWLLPGFFDSNCQFAGALAVWEAGNKRFELCIEAPVVYKMNFPLDNTALLPCLENRKVHLWTARFSTHTQAIAMMPGKDNCNTTVSGDGHLRAIEFDKDEPDSVIPYDISIFDEIINRPASRESIERVKNA